MIKKLTSIEKTNLSEESLKIGLSSMLKCEWELYFQRMFDVCKGLSV